MKKFFVILSCLLIIMIGTANLVFAEGNESTPVAETQSVTNSEVVDTSSTQSYTDDTASTNTEIDTTQTQDQLITPYYEQDTTETSSNRNIYNPISVAIAVVIIGFVAYLVIRYLNKNDDKKIK